MSDVSENNRVRAKLSQTSKGTVQIEVSAEFDTPELVEEGLRKGFLAARKVIADLELKEVPLVEEKDKPK